MQDVVDPPQLIWVWSDEKRRLWDDERVGEGDGMSGESESIAAQRGNFLHQNPFFWDYCGGFGSDTLGRLLLYLFRRKLGVLWWLLYLLRCSWVGCALICMYHILFTFLITHGAQGRCYHYMWRYNHLIHRHCHQHHSEDKGQCGVARPPKSRRYQISVVRWPLL